MTPEEFEKAREYAGQLAKETVAKIRRANEEAAAARRRPLAAMEISTLEGPVLACRVCDRLEFLAADGRREAPRPEQRAVRTLVRLDGEISNGGFHQYFWNTQAGSLVELQQDAAILGDVTAQAVIAEAVARARRYSYRRTWLMRHWPWWWQKQFERGYAERRFDDLDDRYDALSPSVMELTAGFIREHASWFVETV